MSADGGKAIAIGGDLTQAGVARACRGAGRRGRLRADLDILVNNAGDMVERRPFMEMSEDAVAEGVGSQRHLRRSSAPSPRRARMIARKRGAIVNMSSLAAHNGGGAGASAYCDCRRPRCSASPKRMAKELAPHGIRVNCVAPGLIGETAFHGRFTAPRRVQRRSRKASRSAAPARPEEVARVVAFLASDASAFLVGETIEINGGAWFVAGRDDSRASDPCLTYAG